MAGDETDIPRGVRAVNVLSVHLKARVTPARQRDHVFEKETLVRAPLGRNVDAASLATSRVRLTFAATAAARRATEAKIGEQHHVRPGAARASNEDSIPAESAFNGKFAEPVARARERVLAFETSRLAALQESPQWT